MTFTKLEDTYWLLGFLGHVSLLSVLLLHHRWRKFPVFTGLIAYELGESLLLFLVSRYGTPHAYFDTYWLGALADYVLQLGLIVELMAELCRRDGIWIRSARSGMFRWAVFGVLSAGALSLIGAPPSITGLDLWDLRATLFTSLLICELLLGVSMTGNRLHLQRGNQVMALGQGLALWAAVAVLGDVLKVATGWRHEFPIFDQVRMLVYLSDLAFWSVVFWRPQKEPAPFLEQADYLAVLQRTCASMAKPSAASR